MKYKIKYKSIGGADNLGNRIQFNNQNLREAEHLWYDNRQEALRIYGDINTWDVSQVTDMSELFMHSSDFNNNISNWDTSNVTNMESMFDNAHNFDQDISNWNTSNVNNMTNMFCEAYQFNNHNQPLITREVQREDGTTYTAWDVSNVTNMNLMFFDASVFNQNIGNWDVSSVTNMESMFHHATEFNQNIGYWIIGDNCNIENIFENSGVTRETFENRVYGQRIANSFDPPLPNPRTNVELEIYRPRRRIQDRTRLAIVANTLSEDYIIDDSGNQIFFRPIPEIINGEINIDFPVISDREQLRTRLNQINDRDDRQFTEDENREFNLNNIYIDDNGRNFDLFIIVDGNRYPLFIFDENNLIVKKPFPYLSNDLIQNIGNFVGGNNIKL